MRFERVLSRFGRARIVTDYVFCWFTGALHCLRCKQKSKCIQPHQTKHKCKRIKASFSVLSPIYGGPESNLCRCIKKGGLGGQERRGL